ATDKLGPPVSARPVVSYTISWDIIGLRPVLRIWPRARVGDQHSAGNGTAPENGAQNTGGFDQCSVGSDGLLDAFFQL
ncbi:hypothetical protein Q4543_24360, partial [Salipiger sp. 1_MG-2023]|uniref:hypothetical protein n=1 Tax=Salipiger sp. 1_MG-2023 TaxID=3062665 RepID=UPI0026E474E0